MFIAALVKMLPATRASVARLANSDCYHQLVHQVFRPDQERPERRLVAFVSASKRAGATFVTRELALELAEYENERTAVVDAGRLQTISRQDLEKWVRLCAATDAKLSVLEAETLPSAAPSQSLRRQRSSWQHRASYRRECVRILQKHFTSVLLDCPSAGECRALLPSIAELVDGFVLVAEAGKTRRAELQRTEKLIELTQGKVLGLVLNKRRYSIPGWIYKWL